MRLYYDGDKYLTARRAQRPQFRFAKRPGERSRTWDALSTTINGNAVQMRFDSTWGWNFYFTLGDERDRDAKWWSISLRGTDDAYGIIDRAPGFTVR